MLTHNAISFSCDLCGDIYSNQTPTQQSHLCYCWQFVCCIALTSLLLIRSLKTSMGLKDIDMTWLECYYSSCTHSSQETSLAILLGLCNELYFYKQRECSLINTWEDFCCQFSWIYLMLWWKGDSWNVAGSSTSCHLAERQREKQL